MHNVHTHQIIIENYQLTHILLYFEHDAHEIFTRNIDFLVDGTNDKLDFANFMTPIV